LQRLRAQHNSAADHTCTRENVVAVDNLVFCRFEQPKIYRWTHQSGAAPIIYFVAITIVLKYLLFKEAPVIELIEAQPRHARLSWSKQLLNKIVHLVQW